MPADYGLDIRITGNARDGAEGDPIRRAEFLAALNALPSLSLVVDSREACWEEAGDLIVPRAKGLISDESILAELGEIVLGKKPGRESPADMTLFKSVGSGVQDVSVAGKIIEEAAEHGLGTQVDL